MTKFRYILSPKWPTVPEDYFHVCFQTSLFKLFSRHMPHDIFFNFRIFNTLALPLKTHNLIISLEKGDFIFIISLMLG